MMSFDPMQHDRRSIRLKGFDYSQDGALFVTLAAQGSDCLVGKIIDDRMGLNEAGKIIEAVCAYQARCS
jgi:putative transposase